MRYTAFIVSIVSVMTALHGAVLSQSGNGTHAVTHSISTPSCTFKTEAYHGANSSYIVSFYQYMMGSFTADYLSNKGSLPSAIPTTYYAYHSCLHKKYSMFVLLKEKDNVTAIGNEMFEAQLKATSTDSLFMANCTTFNMVLNTEYTDEKTVEYFCPVIDFHHDSDSNGHTIIANFLQNGLYISALVSLMLL
ncbi:hypothetical protein K7432_017512 [Basidiobolus ranarum]|uniref:Uncharacterized protein n=1 Tax=Basidiobolus ranarum TaxID=34480 RepID=A0ABR2WD96_9FUNG